MKAVILALIVLLPAGAAVSAADRESNSQIHLQRGTDQLHRGKFDKAIAELDEAIRADPKNAFAYFARGTAWLGKQEFDKALADFDQTLRLDPTNAAAHGARGGVWAAKKDYDKAIADLNEAIRLDPKEFSHYYNRANVWSNRQDYDRAIADYDLAILLEPNDAQTLSSRGKAWSKKHDYDKAVADYTQALRLDPNHIAANDNFARLRATCPEPRYRNGKQAVELATKACKLSRWKDGHRVETLATAYAEAGDFDAAIKYQNKATQLNAADAELIIRGNQRLALFKSHKPFHEALR